MAGGLITDFFQVEYNGVLIGGDTGYEIVSANHFDLPELRTSDVNRPQRDGQFAGTDFMAGKSIHLQLEAWSSDDVDLGSRLTVLMAAFAPGVTADLVTNIPGLGLIKMECRVRRRSLPMNIDQVGGLTRFAVDLYAVDPVWKSNATSQVELGLTDVSGGLSFPLTFPISFGETNDGSVNLQNDGSYESFPVIVISGPVTDPSLENRSQGKTLSFTGTVAADETLVIDFNARSVLLDGSANRYAWLDDSTKWWSLDPGTNDIWFDGTSAGSPTCLCYWSDAWV